MPKVTVSTVPKPVGNLLLLPKIHLFCGRLSHGHSKFCQCLHVNFYGNSKYNPASAQYVMQSELLVRFVKKCRSHCVNFFLVRVLQCEQFSIGFERAAMWLHDNFFSINEVETELKSV